MAMDLAMVSLKFTPVCNTALNLLSEKHGTEFLLPKNLEESAKFYGFEKIEGKWMKYGR